MCAQATVRRCRYRSWRHEIRPATATLPCLCAYGAYGVTLSATFSPLRRAWFDRGGAYAFVHVRGGGGFGEEWHRAGRLKNKPNSISDFIAAAQYLIHAGWAKPATLSAMGASAGGIVIGGAVVAKPTVQCGGHRCRAGQSIAAEQIPIGPFNTGEFGLTQTEEVYSHAL